MKLTIYHLKNCDTCRKAIKALEGAGHELKLIDVRADGVSVDDLTHLESKTGYQNLLNTRSTTWRGLSDAEKSDLTSAKAIELMSAYPTLIKRPVIVADDEVWLGWTKDVQQKFL